MQKVVFFEGSVRIVGTKVHCKRMAEGEWRTAREEIKKDCGNRRIMLTSWTICFLWP